MTCDSTPGNGQGWHAARESSPQPTLPSFCHVLAVELAAERFHTRCLLRHAFHALRRDAAATRAATQLAANHWRGRQLAAVVQAWRLHAAEAAEWLAAAATALRRRWLLRRWRAVAAAQQWERQAEATADAFSRSQLLATGLQAWRQHMQHEHWRDGAHEAVVRLRMRNMLAA